MSYIDEQINEIAKRNPGEPEFHQAVAEVLKSVEPLIEGNQLYREHSVIQRITEPDRQIKFRVSWRDDKGKIHVNRGYRVQFSNAIGPYKGGLRFHPSVNIGIMKFLGFEQIFKNSLTGLPIGGGKGGSDFDPKGKSDNEIMSFCQSFMTELFRHIGPNTDVPAGDIGVGAREIGYLFGQYKRLKNVYEGAITGKGIGYGGSLARKEATGYGVIYITQELLAEKGMEIKGKIISISGAGNVAIYAAQKAIQLGAKVVTMSDSDGWIYDKDGVDINAVKAIKEEKRGRISLYTDYRPSAEYHSGRFEWSVPCDVAIPCATQNELTIKGAQELILKNTFAVVEGANMPVTAEALSLIREKGIIIIPGKAANAGGVAVSALEMSQNSIRVSWEFDEVDKKLKETMQKIFSSISSTAKEFGDADNYIAGANIAGFKRVSEVLIEQGAV